MGHVTLLRFLLQEVTALGDGQTTNNQSASLTCGWSFLIT